VLSATTEDGSRDSLNLRRPPRRHVFLHRAPETVGHPFERRQDRLRGDLGPLGDSDGAGLLDAPLQERTPLRIRANDPERSPEAVVASAKGAKKQSLLQSIMTSSSRTSQPAQALLGAPFAYADAWSKGPRR
jgi:hypothetical protein